MTDPKYSARRSYSLSYSTKRDADVIAWLDRQTNKTAAIRDLIRMYEAHDGKQQTKEA